MQPRHCSIAADADQTSRPHVADASRVRSTTRSPTRPRPQSHLRPPRPSRTESVMKQGPLPPSSSCDYHSPPSHTHPPVPRTHSCSRHTQHPSTLVPHDSCTRPRTSSTRRTTTTTVQRTRQRCCTQHHLPLGTLTQGRDSPRDSPQHRHRVARPPHTRRCHTPPTLTRTSPTTPTPTTTTCLQPAVPPPETIAVSCLHHRTGAVTFALPPTVTTPCGLETALVAATPGSRS